MVSSSLSDKQKSPSSRFARRKTITAFAVPLRFISRMGNALNRYRPAGRYPVPVTGDNRHRLLPMGSAGTLRGEFNGFRTPLHTSQRLSGFLRRPTGPPHRVGYAIVAVHRLCGSLAVLYHIRQGFVKGAAVWRRSPAAAQRFAARPVPAAQVVARTISSGSTRIRWRLRIGKVSISLSRACRACSPSLLRGWDIVLMLIWGNDA